MKQSRIAVIGPCASGKSSVAAGLRQQGLHAWSVGQEHSEVTDLWRRRTPDYLVYLQISLVELRVRRNNVNWPAWIYALQLERLASGRSRANIVIDTDVLNLQQVINKAHNEILRLQSRSD